MKSMAASAKGGNRDHKNNDQRDRNNDKKEHDASKADADEFEISTVSASQYPPVEHDAND